MNKCIFLGRMTKDIELGTTGGGTTYGKFSLAVDTGYGTNKKTSFLNMVAWGKTAESLNNFAKSGTKLLVECQAIQNSYTDKNGNKVNTVNFNVLSWEFAESKNAKKDSDEQAPAANNSQPQFNADGFMNISEGNEEELPFF